LIASLWRTPKLLVDDQQAQARELDVLGQQLVRADHDVDRAGFHAGQRGVDFLGGAKARQFGHLHRPGAEAVDDRLVVLLGQQRGRRQDGHMLAAHHSDEGRAQRHLRLAEADVAADQAVHRLRAHQVLDHGVDRGALVGRLLEAEAGCEGLVVVRRIAVRVALARGPARVERQQLGRGVAHLLGGLALGLLPLARAELVQRCFVGRHAGVAADQVQLRHRHIQRGLVRVFEVQELARPVAEVDVQQPLVAPDAVVDMHHRVADLELRQVLDQRVDIADLFLLATPARRRRGGEELGLGDELDRRCLALTHPVETGSQRRRDDRHLLVAGLELGQRGHAGHFDLVVAQQVEQAFAPAFALSGDQHAGPGRREVPLEQGHRLGGVAVDGHVGQRPRPVHRLHPSHHQRRVRLRQREELLGAQEDVLRREDRALGVVLQETVALARVGPEARQRRVDLAVQHQRGAGAEVVEQRGGLLEEERQVVLDARGGDAGAEVLVDAALGRVAVELFAPARAEGRARGVVEREFAARQQTHLGHRVQAALTVGVEGADRVDLVAEQVHAVGHGRAHREQVDQAAAHRVLAGRHDLTHVRVACERELRLQRGLVELVLLLELEGGRGEERGRRQARQRGRGRQQHHVHVLRRPQAPQRGQALADQVLVRAEGVVGQGLPVGKRGDAQPRREERQLVGQALSVGRLGGHHRGEAAALRLRRDQQGVGRSDGAGQRETLAGGDGGQLHEGREF
jgi:hypothetical protein